MILAIVGLAGAGKTEATEYVFKKTNWPKVYFGQIVLDEVKNRGMEINEANERMVREDLRKTHGMAAMAILSVPKIKELAATAPHVLVESMYSWEEYAVLKQEFGENFKVLAIFASPKTRTARMAVRPVRPLTSQELESRDYSQIENLHQAGPIARADWMVVNESSKEELYKNIDQIMEKLA